MSSSRYDQHVQNESVVWICHHCGTSNYEGSFTFHSYELDQTNHFSALANLPQKQSVCSPREISESRHSNSPLNYSSPNQMTFHPKWASSPTETPNSRTKSKNFNGKHNLSLESSISDNTSSNASSLPAKGKNWRILSLNINGLRGKREELALAVDYVKPDVIIGCESKISEEMNDAELFPANYRKDVFRNDRTEFGGGVFLAFRDGHNPSQIKVETENEAIWANVPMTKGPPLKLCSFYRPPHSGPQPLSDLDDQVAKVNEKGDANIIVAGDFNCKNIDWSIPKIYSNAEDKETHQQLLDLLTNQSLTNIQCNATRGPSNLDLVLASNTSLVKSISVIPGLSDHEMIVVDTDLSPTVNKTPPRHLPKYHKADWEKIKNMTAGFSSDFLKCCESRTVNENWTSFKDHLKSMLDSIPSKAKSHKNRLPWINGNILRLIRKKKRLYRKAKKKNRPSDWKDYQEMKKQVRKEIRKAHGNYIENTLKTTLEDGNTKPLWSYIKERKRDACGVAPLKNNGHLETDARQKAEILSKQFSSVFTKENDSIGEIPKTGGDRRPTIEPLEITPKGVEKLLKSIKTSKAHGPDGIPNMLLKTLATEITPALTFIFNQSLKTGEVPTDWKLANITPIFKKDDKHTPANYRPVSLTCVCSKIMEHIIVSHLMKHLEKHNILTDRQHGFRQKRSCVTQLLLTTSDLSKYYDDNTQVDLCILDFSKAFDVVSHKKLLSKLDHYGIRDQTLKWITDFLSDRKQCVVVDGYSSEPSPVISGVPQGTCLGPVLFLCYINDIELNVLSDLRLFADDALLYRAIRSTEDQTILQKDLDQLQKWARSWDMNFNPKKCYIMSLKRTGRKESKYYTLKNEILQTVRDNPYLGVLLSDDTSFSAHINKICSKTSKTIGFLNRNLKHCPKHLRSMAYTSMCRSTLEYASQIWDPHLKKEIDQLEKVQRKAARMATRNFDPKSSVTALLENLKWEPLELRRKKSRLTLFHQIIREEVAVPIDRNLLTQGRRGRYKHLTHQHLGYKNSFYPRTIRDWNLLPPSIKSSPDLDTFKAGLFPPNI